MHGGKQHLPAALKILARGNDGGMVGANHSLGDCPRIVRKFGLILCRLPRVGLVGIEINKVRRKRNFLPGMGPCGAYETAEMSL
jgi:hypothetical protein